MSEGGAFLTDIDAEFKQQRKQENKNQNQNQQDQLVPQQPQSNAKKLEPLNLKNTQPPKQKIQVQSVQNKTAQQKNQNNQNNIMNKRNSVGQSNNNNQNKKDQKQLAPIKKNNQPILSKTVHGSKSFTHLGENKLKTFKSVMDQVKVDKTGKKEKNIQVQSTILDSQDYLKKYKEKIIKDIETIYSYSEYTKVSNELKRLESKQFIQSEIQRAEALINKQKKMYNETHYKLQNKEKQLKTINNEISKVENLLTQGSQMKEYKEAVTELQDYEEQNGDIQFRQEALEYMVGDRQKMVLNARNEVLKLYTDIIKTNQEIIKVEEDLQKHGSNSGDREKGVQELRMMVEEYQRALRYENVIMGQHFEDQLEDELSEYEDKRALKQIFKYEARRKEEAERDRQEIREQQNQKTREEKKKEQDKINKEMQEIKQVLNLEISKFQKLEKATGINVDLVKNLNTKDEVQKLERILGYKINQEQKNSIKFDKNIYILYKESLEKDNKNMEQHFKNKFEEKILETKQKINELKQQIQIIKYSEKPNEKAYDPNLIENLEEELISERDHCQDKENQLRKEEKIIDNICIVISRISYQLPFGKQSKDRNVKVLRKDLLDQISICGLQLEKMLAILSKKKDTIRIESVNTASDNKSPPEYLGLNNKIIKQIQTKNPKYNYSLSERVDESLDSMNNFPVKYMGIQQFIYAQDKLGDRQTFNYEQSYEDQQNNSRQEEDMYFEDFRRQQKNKILERQSQD